MVDWTSTATLAANALSFNNLLHVMLGVYIWEWANTLDFEWSLLTGRRKFRWPLIPYFYCRYAMLGGLVGFIIALNNTTHEMDCPVLFIILSFLGDTALGAASINLAIRTMAIYKDSKFVVFPLIVLILGHWAIIIKSVTNVHAQWVDGSGCVTVSNAVTFFIVMYVYTTVFDLIVLILMAYKLRVSNPSAGASPIARMMFIDGLGYFLLAVCVNVIAVVFSVLDLNPVMGLIADVPATTFATIFSCRVVRRLYQFQNNGPTMFSHHSSGPRYPITGNAASVIPVSGVHVQMSTFTQADDMHKTDGEYKHSF